MQLFYLHYVFLLYVSIVTGGPERPFADIEDGKNNSFDL